MKRPDKLFPVTLVGSYPQPAWLIDRDPATIFGSNGAKESYLRSMQERRMLEIEKLRAGWAHPDVDILAALQEWFTPLLAEADHIAGGIDGGVRLTAEDEQRGDVDILGD